MEVKYTVTCPDCKRQRCVSQSTFCRINRLHTRCMSCTKKEWRPTQQHREKLKARTGNKSHRWLLGNISYNSLHKRLRAKWGKPTKCVECGCLDKPTKDGRSYIQWANLSGKYLYDRSDWKALCYRCHRLLDLNKDK